MTAVEEVGTGSIAEESGAVGYGVGVLVGSDDVGTGVGTVGVADSVGLGDWVGVGEDVSVVLPEGSPGVGGVGLVAVVGVATGDGGVVVPVVLSADVGASETVNDTLDPPGGGQAVTTSRGTGAPVAASVVVPVGSGAGGCAVDRAGVCVAGVCVAGVCVAGARPPSTLASGSAEVRDAVGDTPVTIPGRMPRSSTSASSAATVSPIAVRTVSTSTGWALLAIDVLLRGAALRPRRRHRHEALRP